MEPRHPFSEWSRARQLVSPAAGREEGAELLSSLSAHQTAAPFLISVFSSYIHDDTLPLGKYLA